jgi:hypothetical protein
MLIPEEDLELAKLLLQTFKNTKLKAVMQKIKIGHIGIHEKANLNSGDTLLFQVVRDLFETILDVKIEWNLYQVWENFDEDTIDQMNKENNVLIIGGGGLLLKDQKGADIYE